MLGSVFMSSDVGKLYALLCEAIGRRRQFQLEG
jgi:hypothetical protein